MTITPQLFDTTPPAPFPSFASVMASLPGDTLAPVIRDLFQPATATATATTPPAAPRSSANLMASLPGEILSPIMEDLFQTVPHLLMCLSRETWNACLPVLYSDITLSKRNRRRFGYGFGGKNMNGRRGDGEWDEIHRVGRKALVQGDGAVPKSTLGRRLVSLDHVRSVCLMDRSGDSALISLSRRARDKFHVSSLLGTPEGITPTIIFQVELTSVWFADGLWTYDITTGGQGSFYCQLISCVFPGMWKQVMYLPADLSKQKLRREAYEWLEGSVNREGKVEELCADQVWPCEMSILGTEKVVELACPRGREWGCDAGHRRDEDCIVQCLVRWTMPFLNPWTPSW
ncbi:hypothetical protein IAT38_003605 [Cryptococcus sp. DSM 104549]